MPIMFHYSIKWQHPALILRFEPLIIDIVLDSAICHVMLVEMKREWKVQQGKQDRILSDKWLGMSVKLLGMLINIMCNVWYPETCNVSQPFVTGGAKYHSFYCVFIFSSLVPILCNFQVPNCLCAQWQRFRCFKYKNWQTCVYQMFPLF